MKQIEQFVELARAFHAEGLIYTVIGGAAMKTVRPKDHIDAERLSAEFEMGEE